MLADFLYLWNPFDIYGKEVGIDELIESPLRHDETLRQDSHGRFKRIHVPGFQSSLWEKIIYRLQITFNKVGHEATIEKLISLFSQKVIASSPEKTQALKDIYTKIDRLRSLKNDNGFSDPCSSDSSFIDLRLREIEEQAYCNFSYLIQIAACDEEKTRKEQFLLFEKEFQDHLKELGKEHSLGLLKAKLVGIVPFQILKEIFDHSSRNIHKRLIKIQELSERVNKIEELHKGKFTIPFIDVQIEKFRKNLKREICKIEAEARLIFHNIIISYRLCPFRDEVKILLDEMRIKPETVHDETLCSNLFETTIDVEIRRVRNMCESIKESNRLQ